MANRNILVINCGSSTIKFSLVDSETEVHIIKGIAERLGSRDALLRWQASDQKSGSKSLGDADHRSAMESIETVLIKSGTLEKPLAGVGHRVVHGGEHFSESTLIDDRVLAAIKSCSHLAPLHNPANLLGIRMAQHYFPDVPHVAVFDTAFHHSLPERAYLYAIPYGLYEDHKIRRYGFHGTSHRFVTRRAAELLDRPLEECAFVSAHLGNGCSACAVLGGKSVDTTMGMTPLEGLVMGTRSGDVDPGLHGYLEEQLKWSAERITNTLNRESGLLGLSGISNDMRELMAAAAKGQPRAKVAIEVFCYRLAKSLATMFVSLGQIGTIIFTGGIGENEPDIRAKVIHQLGFLGFKLHPDRNMKNGLGNKGRITRGSRRIAMVVPTDEELMIAHDTVSVTKHDR
ncbi:MAG: acetate/propionate family kinase [Deltaproteobacteria bacterium]|nr:acetate/propionate family kinase [Deltaproteobacteria bacterium]